MLKPSKWPQILLPLVLAACATPSQPSATACPALPPKPPVLTPPPSQPYLQSANANISKWQKLLQDTLTTPKP